MSQQISNLPQLARLCHAGLSVLLEWLAKLLKEFGRIPGYEVWFSDF
jgi:hypothetical protein